MTVGRAFAVAAALGLGLAAGCATREPVEPAAAATAATATDGLKARYCGQVVRVRSAGQYVVIECGWPPPAGTEVALMRGGVEVGRARVTARRRGVFVTAEVLKGEPAVGDAIGSTGGSEDKR